MNILLKEFQRELIAVVTNGTIIDRNTGEPLQGTTSEVHFKGCILPMTYKDLQITTAGQFSIDDRKLYTESGIKLAAETKIKAGKDKKGLDIIYEIYAGNDYGVINPDFKQYFMKRMAPVDGK